MKTRWMNKTEWSPKSDFIRDDNNRLIVLNKMHMLCFGHITENITTIYGDIFDKSVCRHCTLEISCRQAAFHETKKYKDFHKASRKALYRQKYKT